MSSGTKRLILNTRERLVSTDHNRLQAFLAASAQESWRALHEPRGNFRFYPGLSLPVQTVMAPLHGDVLTGLFVRPDAPDYLLIDAGVAMVVDTNGVGTDDSAYLLCQDPGVSVPGVLTFTANPTPGTVRWDVVECQPADTLLESYSRDIFNPATGLFVPATVDKVRTTRLTYRIRLGTPGAGFPGPSAGWLPLAVTAVLNGAAGFHQCDFYDVRPLVSERARPQPVSGNNEGWTVLGACHYNAFSGAFSGHVETEFGGYLAGGSLRTSIPVDSLANFGVYNTTNGGDSRKLDYANTANRSTVTLSGDDLLYAVALFPRPASGQGFIPRWARYSEAPVPALGRRVPNGPRGILVLTTTEPSGPNNIVPPMSFPGGMQFGGEGVGVALAMNSAFGGTLGGSVQVNGQYDHSKANGDVWAISVTSVAPDLAVWDLVPGTHYPHGAKGIRCSFHFVCSAGSSFEGFQIRSTGAGVPASSVFVPSGYPSGALAAATAQRHTITVLRPPLDPNNDAYPVASNSNWSLRAVPSGASPVTFAVADLYIHGWVL